MSTIRKAMIVDASRIAEILIFTKRMNYRSIYNDDKVSFGEMQVYPLAKEYIENPDALKNIWVYEDEFVKEPYDRDVFLHRSKVLSSYWRSHQAF